VRVSFIGQDGKRKRGQVVAYVTTLHRVRAVVESDGRLFTKSLASLKVLRGRSYTRRRG
jgi:hypothetical protein